jgi:hypothetical protein
MELLKKIWKTWKAIADRILRTAFQIILLVFYFTVLVPFSIIFNLTDKETFLAGWKPSNESQAKDMY